jgi:ferredoxin-type protein NapH
VSYLATFAEMLGRAPRRPDKVSDEVREIMSNKRIRRAELLAELERDIPTTWRNRRWAVLISVNGLFTLSFWLDIQLV